MSDNFGNYQTLPLAKGVSFAGFFIKRQSLNKLDSLPLQPKLEKYFR